MSKISKMVKILNENVEKLNKEDQEIFTDIILRIRYETISENDAEEFLQQLLDASLQAEKEGKSIQDVLGTDDIDGYCNEIIKEYKSKYPLWKQICNYLSLALIVLLVFTGFFELLLNVIEHSIIKKALVLDVDITINTLVTYGIACLVTYLVFKVLLKKAPKVEEHKLKTFLFLFAMNITLILTFVGSQLLFRNHVLFTINILYFAVIVPILYFVTNKLSK